MRRPITLSVTFVAIITAMAGFASASASAKSVLCDRAEAPCPSGGVLPAGTWLTTGVGGKPNGFTITTGTGEPKLSCEWATIGAKSVAEGGNPLPAESWTSLQSSTCGGFGGQGGCTSASMNTPPASIEATGSGSGVIDVGTKEHPLTVSFNCVSVQCTYSAASPVPVEVNSAGEAMVSKVPLTRTEGGFLCGQTGSSLVLNMTGAVGTPGVWISNY